MSERGRTAQHAVDLQAARDQASQLQAHVQWLQNEWDAAKQRVEELSQRTAQHAADLQAARDQASQLQAHAESLQNQWAVTEAKVEELNQSSHHWWTVADRSCHELEKVYASLSWRLTTPLRSLKFQSRRLLNATIGVESRPVHRPVKLTRSLSIRYIAPICLRTLDAPGGVVVHRRIDAVGFSKKLVRPRHDRKHLIRWPPRRRPCWLGQLGASLVVPSGSTKVWFPRLPNVDARQISSLFQLMSLHSSKSKRTTNVAANSMSVTTMQ